MAQISRSPGLSESRRQNTAQPIHIHLIKRIGLVAIQIKHTDQFTGLCDHRQDQFGSG